MSNLKEKEEEFLIGLNKLTKETGIKIHGCGCCGSPYLCEADISSEDSGYAIIGKEQVMWIDPSDSYDWETYSKDIIRRI